MEHVALARKLIVLGEMDAEMLGRRLDDRIPKLAAIAEDFPGDSPMRQRITDQIKAEISEYFEREKNPRYDADRRSHKGKLAGDLIMKAARRAKGEHRRVVACGEGVYTLLAAGAQSLFHSAPFARL